MLAIRNVLAAVFFALVLAGGALQTAPAGCVVAGADLPAALAEAQAAPARCLEIPAGVYPVGAPSNGAWLNVDADNLAISGAGAGKTIVQITAPLTLTQDMAIVRLFGVGQSIRDLTIDMGAGHTGAGSLLGISVYGSGGIGPHVGRGLRATIERVELTGGYSANGSS